uniref:Uncharacterized protein n=1 Tax=Arion vulgaris TaxID=1028688 RepID=A0A0B7BTA7_9EUPU
MNARRSKTQGMRRQKSVSEPQLSMTILNFQGVTLVTYCSLAKRVGTKERR